jgi:hypothetical protein
MKLLKNSMIGQDVRLLLSIAFILIWTAVNASFFTWLLIGGVIVILLINKFSKTPNFKSGN